MQLPKVRTPQQEVYHLMAPHRQWQPDRQLAHVGQRGQGAQ